MYIRPVYIGISPHVGVHASEDYMLIIMVMPVGPYYKEGFVPVRAYVQEQFDRAAPRGVGHVKAGGNYAAGLMADCESKVKGFPISMYLDSESHQYIDEFGTSNFFAITPDKKYVTPASGSILPSITNMSLQQLAQDDGMVVERRKIHVSELKNFSEVGACGTAAVITPVYSILHGEQLYTFGEEAQAGKTLTQLFDTIQGIQYGELADKHSWMLTV
jgi:branched-chain amino acid aminotransferase